MKTADEKRKRMYAMIDEMNMEQVEKCISMLQVIASSQNSKLSEAVTTGKLFTDIDSLKKEYEQINPFKGVAI